MAVGGAQQPFARAIDRMLRLDDLRPSDDEACRQPRAHGLGDIRHRLELGHTAMVEPVEHLLGAQLGRLGVESRLGEQFGDPRAGEPDEVDPPIFARSNFARHSDRIDLSGDRHEGGVGHSGGI